MPKNRIELEKIADEAKAKGIHPFVNGNTGWKGVNEWLVSSWYGNYAGAETVYKALKQDIKWDDPLLVDSIKLLSDYMNKGYFRGSKANYFATDFPEIGADLATGKGVFDFAGTWAFGGRPTEFKDNPSDWEWTEVPSLRDGVKPSFPIGIGSTPSFLLTILAEVGCSVLLVLGLYTRLAALVLAFTMGVAFVVVNSAKLMDNSNGELAWLFFGGFLVLLFAGAGKYSIDKK